MGDSHSTICCGFMFHEIEVNTDPPRQSHANRKESEVNEEDPPRLISAIVHDHLENTYNPDDENMEEPYYMNYNAYESDGGLSGISEGTEDDETETETDIDSDDNENTYTMNTTTTTKTNKHSNNNTSTTISKRNKITYSKCNHLQHHYICPIFYISESNKRYLITSTQTFLARNDEGAGIFLYDILENKWLKYAAYPEYLEFNNHGHALDQYNHLLYVYQDLDRNVFTIFDIRHKKWSNMTINNNDEQYNNNNNYEQDINDDADSTAEEPRLYQEINSLYIPSPFNELHFIANTNVKTHHFKYKPRGAGYYELNEMAMDGLLTSFVLNPKIVYVEYLNILIAFGGYNGSLHRDISFLQYDNIWTCDLNQNIDENINGYQWKASNHKLPFKSAMFDVILGFGNILFFFYGEKVYCLDLFDHIWYKLGKKYPVDECYDLMMINDDMNNIHFIHCANAMGPLSFNNFGGSLDNNDKGYHIKISLFDILPTNLTNRYKEKFPLLLYALIRNTDDFNDKIPNDLLKLILTYFHTLCV